MKKTNIIQLFIFAFFMLLSSFNSMSQKVEADMAKRVAKNLYLERYNISSDSKLEPSEIKIRECYSEKVKGNPLFYVVNIEKGGYVLVSGNESVQPILAYGFEENFTSNDMPPQLEWLINVYKKEISSAYQGKYAVEKEVKAEWDKYINGAFDSKDAKSVSPLIATSWDQGAGWNDMCPEDQSGPGGHAYAGCLATSMAQVLKYWAFPSQTNGVIPGYNSANYGWIDQINQSSLSYGASNTTPEYHSQRLLYFCGVSVRMDYGPDGSGASTSTALRSLKDYFSYSRNGQYLRKASYPVSTWEQMLKQELIEDRPVIYRGDDGGPSGHSFIIDGYQSTNHFHINWGWSGSSNGYYYLNDLCPGGYNFNERQYGVFNLEPCHDNLYLNTNMYTDYTLIAGNKIEAYAIVGNGANVNLSADNVVWLRDGFRAVEGSYFHADNNGCSYGSKSNLAEGYENIGNNTNSEYSSLGQNTDSNAENLSIYPNPTQGYINIDVADASTISKIEIRDQFGKLVLLNDVVANNNKFNFNGLSKGMYLAYIYTKESVKIEKIIYQ